MSNVKALCFDTGGTILDWHTGMRTALAAVGVRHGIERDWAWLANEFRRSVPPTDREPWRTRAGHDDVRRRAS